MITGENNTLRGPFSLNRVSILANVLDQTEILILIKSEDNSFVYLERTDNLKLALLSHVPENEKMDELKKVSPDRFVFRIVDDREYVFNLECRWFHMLSPVCNKTHPAFYPNKKVCPICGFGSNVDDEI
ncbi:hypothetical protein KA005_19275 [bacterium]|nr:hypothetical protein [bacterium]